MLRSTFRPESPSTAAPGEPLSPVHHFGISEEFKVVTVDLMLMVSYENLLQDQPGGARGPAHLDADRHGRGVHLRQQRLRPAGEGGESDQAGAGDTRDNE